MLLGIAAHASLAYGEIPWFVHDSPPHPVYDLYFLATRGFRMPMFFLLSGFFTAMVYRRRGLRYLIRHRAGRILLPLILACLTVLPVLSLVHGLADETVKARAGAGTDRETSIWSAAATGDLEALQQHIDERTSLDREEGVTGQSPLAWAVIGNRPEAVRLLIGAGADPSARFRDDNTALHTAAVFGRADCARLLIDAGADVLAENAFGARPMKTLRTGRRMTEDIADSVGIETDHAAVNSGRKRIAAMLTEHGVPAIPLKFDRPASDFSLTREIRRLIRTPFFHHLWFLWFLCFLVAGFAVVTLLPLPRMPRFLVTSGARWLWIVPLTMIPQAAMQKGGSMAGFGPDLSTSLLPMPHVLFYYAIFFGFGALVFEAGDEERRLTRYWWAHLPLALLVVLPLALGFALHEDWTADLVSERWQRLVASFLVVVFAWLMTFGTMGFFGAFLNRESPRLRYLSDASYWLYLVHLPLMVLAQTALLGVPIPTFVKFTLVLVVVTGILLVVYRFGVRHTAIGRLLNGPRERRDSPDRSGATPR